MPSIVRHAFGVVDLVSFMTRRAPSMRTRCPSFCRVDAPPNPFEEILPLHERDVHLDAERL